MEQIATQQCLCTCIRPFSNVALWTCQRRVELNWSVKFDDSTTEAQRLKPRRASTVWHDRGCRATRLWSYMISNLELQSSVTRAEYSVDPPRFHSKLCWPKMTRIHKTRVLNGTTKHSTTFQTTVVLKSRLSRALFSLARHDLSTTFETALSTSSSSSSSLKFKQQSLLSCMSM